MSDRVTRRAFLKGLAIAAGGGALAACKPQVVKETVVVEKPVEKVVKETVVVEKPVEKVVKETVQVEKVVEKIITATPAPAAPIIIDEGGNLLGGWWVNGDGHEDFFETYVVPRFKEMHPEAQFKDPPTSLAGRGMESVEKFLIALATGDVPDLIGGGEENPPAYGGRGILLNLRPYMEKDPGFWLNNDHCSQALLESDSTPDGGTYAVTGRSFSTWLVFNKDLFEERGVDLPPESLDDPKMDSWNWAKFLETAQALTIDEDGDGEPEIFGVSVGSWWAHWMPFVWSNGARLLSDDWKTAKYDTPEFAEAIDFYAGLITEYGVAPSAASSRFVEEGVGAMFNAGAIAMMLDNGWQMPGAISNPPEFTVGTAPIPWGKEEMKGKPFQGQVSSQLAVWSQTKHPDVMWDLLSLIYNEETQKKWYEETYQKVVHVPTGFELAYWEELNTRDDAYAMTAEGAANANFKLYRQILDSSWPGPWVFAFPEMEAAMNPVVQQIMAGDTTAAESMAAVNEEVQALLDEWAE
jgi:multiple sugar transport system substrate-binding protein